MNQNKDIQKKTQEESLSQLRMMVEFSDILPPEAYSCQELLNFLESEQTKKEK